MSAASWSVVIPFKNAGATLDACLQAVARQTLLPKEVILVDNGSKDNSLSIVEEYARKERQFLVLCLSEPIPGAAAARNLGISKACGEWVVFTDSDCVPDPGWLQDLDGAVAKQSGIGALAGVVRPCKAAGIIERFVGMFSLNSGEAEATFTRFTLVDGGFPTANLAVRKDVLAQAGGFDAAMLYGEDHDLCRRIYEAGFSIRKISGALVEHRHRASLSGLCRQARAYGRAHAILLSRQPGGAVIVDSPFGRVQAVGRGGRIWIDLNQADKKMMAGCIGGLLWTPLWVLVPLYFLYLVYWMSRRPMPVDERAIKAGEAVCMASLMVIKAANMTTGCVLGSVRKGVLCL